MVVLQEKIHGLLTPACMHAGTPSDLPADQYTAVWREVLEAGSGSVAVKDDNGASSSDGGSGARTAGARAGVLELPPVLRPMLLPAFTARCAALTVTQVNVFKGRGKAVKSDYLDPPPLSA
jgi:hypothetical protein